LPEFLCLVPSSAFTFASALLGPRQFVSSSAQALSTLATFSYCQCNRISLGGRQGVDVCTGAIERATATRNYGGLTPDEIICLTSRNLVAPLFPPGLRSARNSKAAVYSGPF
jgi:hypothetical protein